MPPCGKLLMYIIEAFVARGIVSSELEHLPVQKLQHIWKETLVKLRSNTS